jgi:hypothetical protein
MVKNFKVSQGRYSKAEKGFRKNPLLLSLRTYREVSFFKSGPAIFARNDKHVKSVQYCP